MPPTVQKTAIKRPLISTSEETIKSYSSKIAKEKNCFVAPSPVNSTKIIQLKQKITEPPKPTNRKSSTSRVVHLTPASVKQLCSRWEVILIVFNFFMYFKWVFDAVFCYICSK